MYTHIFLLFESGKVPEKEEKTDECIRIRKKIL